VAVCSNGWKNKAAWMSLTYFGSRWAWGKELRISIEPVLLMLT
jgi:hypothetical protein